MQKILLALQFWEGDKAEAMKRARLIADLQPGHSDKADFLFVSRFDCTQDMGTVEQVSRKFNTHHVINRRRGEGWPHGCNELFFGTMDWVFSHAEAGRIPDYKAILTFEADSCPLHPNWINDLSASWDAAKTYVHGPLLENGVPGAGGHINGNCMMSGDMKFLKWLTREKGGCTPVGGWDYLFYPEFKRWGAKDAPGMKSWWRVPSINQETYDSLLAQNVCFLHGCKDDSLVRLVRSRFL